MEKKSTKIAYLVALVVKISAISRPGKFEQIMNCTFSLFSNSRGVFATSYHVYHFF